MSNNDKLHTLFFKAVSEDNVKLASLVLDKGLDVNIFSSKNLTALYMACFAGSLDMVEMLIYKGSQVDLSNHIGVSPLMMAAFNDNHSCVESLLNNNANVNANNMNGETALHVCAHRDSFKSARVLINNGAELDPISIDSGFTPLHFSCLNKKFLLLKFLVDSGADLKIKDKKGNSAFHLSVIAGSFDVFRYMLLNSINNINDKNNDDETLLHSASQFGHLRILNVLLKEKNIDLYAVNKYGNNCLHDACALDRDDIVKAIIKKDFNIIFSKNRDGKTPVDIAIENNNQSIVKLLNESLKSVEVTNQLLSDLDNKVDKKPKAKAKEKSKEIAESKPEPEELPKFAPGSVFVKTQDGCSPMDNLLKAVFLSAKKYPVHLRKHRFDEGESEGENENENENENELSFSGLD